MPRSHWTSAGLMFFAAWLPFAVARPAPAAEAQAQPSAEELQRQIEEVRQTLQELETQLKSAQAAQAKTVQGEKVKISGYIQGRFVDEQDADSDFNIARARLKLDGHVTDRSTFTFQVDARSRDGRVDLRDAYIDYLSADKKTWSVRVGQAKVPIMYEVIESSSVRLAPERTAVARALFPGERDVGILFNCKPAQWRGVSLDLGLVNGQGRNADDKNNHKDILLRLVAPLRGGTAYVGFYDGSVTTDGATTVKSRFAVGTEQTWGPASFRAEYLQGRNLGMDVAGWYAQAAVSPRQGPDTIFVRYDQYDENRNAADTTFRRTTIGWQHKLDSKTRTTVAFESKSADGGFTNAAADGEAVEEDALTVQLQVGY